MIYKGTNKNDTLVGTDADDTFLPLRGFDTVDGGTGHDTLIVDYSKQEYTINNTTIRIAADGTMSGRLNGLANHVDYQNIEAIDYKGTLDGEAMIISTEAALDGTELTLDANSGTDLLWFTSTAHKDHSRLEVASDGSIAFSDGELSGFETFWLSLGSGADVARTGSGDDRLDGGRGRDHLSGGAGQDKITGGIGADVMAGGAGSDTFVFESRADLGSLDGRLDFITDFSGEGDLIVLDAIDPDRMQEGDQSFTFIGNQAFTGTGGTDYELRYSTTGENLYLVEADVDHDGAADFAFQLGSDHAPVPVDFIL